MLNPYAGMALVACGLAGLFVIARYARARDCISPECSRKLIHVGMGTVCLAFPWLFSDALPVLVLAVLAAAALLAVRSVPVVRLSFGIALHGVERRSYGEFAFVAGVACAFVLAHGSILGYVIPVAVLTFADAFAAIVGLRFGAHRFKTPGGVKSLEGSLAFFVAAIACVTIPLTMGGPSDALLVALPMGLALMLVEAFSGGLDNFAIPVMGGVLLRMLSGSAGTFL